MKVIILNGSPKAKGNTATALREVEKVLNQQGIETEFIHVGNKDIRGCIACGSCYKNGKCVFANLDYEEYVLQKTRALLLSNQLYLNFVILNIQNLFYISFHL